MSAKFNERSFRLKPLAVALLVALVSIAAPVTLLAYEAEYYEYLEYTPVIYEPTVPEYDEYEPEIEDGYEPYDEYEPEIDDEYEPYDEYEPEIDDEYEPYDEYEPEIDDEYEPYDEYEPEIEDEYEPYDEYEPEIDDEYEPDYCECAECYYCEYDECCDSYEYYPEADEYDECKCEEYDCVCEYCECEYDECKCLENNGLLPELPPCDAYFSVMLPADIPFAIVLSAQGGEGFIFSEIFTITNHGYDPIDVALCTAKIIIDDPEFFSLYESYYLPEYGNYMYFILTIAHNSPTTYNEAIVPLTHTETIAYTEAIAYFHSVYEYVLTDYPVTTRHFTLESGQSMYFWFDGVVSEQGPIPWSSTTVTVSTSFDIMAAYVPDYLPMYPPEFPEFPGILLPPIADDNPYPEDNEYYENEYNDYEYDAKEEYYYEDDYEEPDEPDYEEPDDEEPDEPDYEEPDDEEPDEPDYEEPDEEPDEDEAQV
ncbi:MAG: hypothetical protein FWB91_02725 [Defluviitaleaceae bacterium]|nr:hypothetical protein [Defluviitaleaceae bacterium]